MQDRMTALTQDTLPDLSMGFLSDTRLRAAGQGVLVTAGYDLARYDETLFERLGVAPPDSLSRAVAKRRSEYLAGRAMARVAQTALGVDGTVHIGADRAPVWPEGQAGSISHARARCACLLMPQGQGAPGVDVEAVAEGHALDAILRATLDGAERDLIARTPDPDLAATLCFSAKETLYKALYPTVRAFFGFDSAQLTGLPEGGGLTLTLTKSLHPDLPRGRSFDIRYETDASHVLTWVVHR
ncbi:4'-phosphopantetheinyl transferase [Aestuariicoccus sp. MJ-SS9]|uniref:4'-phosphopantetheinyl transferase family protein n=1 Tax=Aestuariicoccus sp. MJ-SS9 TaxID=3079855 RepID=UPI002911F583|nr:4'-phosphopantetheinyl transferase superfamily protein [Aestuariicoccus sp. MJ-SS9]MDU8913965.1 4'-phosphopantetheinyl transferase superfamily protein [Aestuariicoccus sp. MJ-SS9]